MLLIGAAAALAVMVIGITWIGGRDDGPTNVKVAGRRSVDGEVNPDRSDDDPIAQTSDARPVLPSVPIDQMAVRGSVNAPDLDQQIMPGASFETFVAGKDGESPSFISVISAEVERVNPSEVREVDPEEGDIESNDPTSISNDRFSAIMASLGSMVMNQDLGSNGFSMPITRGDPVLVSFSNTSSLLPQTAGDLRESMIRYLAYNGVVSADDPSALEVEEIHIRPGNHGASSQDAPPDSSEWPTIRVVLKKLNGRPVRRSYTLLQGKEVNAIVIAINVDPNIVSSVVKDLVPSDGLLRAGRIPSGFQRLGPRSSGSFDPSYGVAFAPEFGSDEVLLFDAVESKVSGFVIASRVTTLANAEQITALQTDSGLVFRDTGGTVFGFRGDVFVQMRPVTPEALPADRDVWLTIWDGIKPVGRATFDAALERGQQPGSLFGD